MFMVCRFGYGVKVVDDIIIEGSSPVSHDSCSCCSIVHYYNFKRNNY